MSEDYRSKLDNEGQSVLDTKQHQADNDVLQMIAREKGATETQNADVDRMSAELLAKMQKPSKKTVE